MHHIYQFSNKSHQHGGVLMVMLVVFVLGISAIILTSLNKVSVQTQRDRTTEAALAQAREALIGFANKVPFSNSNSCYNTSSNTNNCARPGELPCPDTDDDGLPGNSTTTTCDMQSQRMGRLPWKTLAIPDLRDGNGERLWYAVSTKFKNSPRSNCSTASSSGCLNSDTTGSITVFSSNGSLLNDGGSTGTGVAAVIIAPGEPLSGQNRSTGNTNTASNYLDAVTVAGVLHNNASFIDGSSSDGFIQGRITNNDILLLNDRIQLITVDNIMKGVTKRVAGEVRNCLMDYAQNNSGRYPWATPIDNLSQPYSDNTDTFFGRIPDNLNNTRNDSNDQMSNQWGTCSTHFNTTPAGWWYNWKDMVFYGVARKFRPKNEPAPVNMSECATAGNCLNINNNATPAKFVVIVSGKKIPPQTRSSNSDKISAGNFLESGNQNADQTGGYTYTNVSPSATFNDTLRFK